MDGVAKPVFFVAGWQNQGQKPNQFRLFLVWKQSFGIGNIDLEACWKENESGFSG